MLTFQGLADTEEINRIGELIWKYATGTLTSWKGYLNWMALSNSTAERGAPMQVIKQSEHGRTLTTEEQKCSSFQTNYD